MNICIINNKEIMETLYACISGEYLFLILKGIFPIEICNNISSNIVSKNFIQCVPHNKNCYVCNVKSSNKKAFGLFDKIIVIRYCSNCNLFINKLCSLNTFEECINSIKSYADKCNTALTKAYSYRNIDMKIDYYHDAKKYFKIAIINGNNIIELFNNDDVTKMVCDILFILKNTMYIIKFAHVSITSILETLKLNHKRRHLQQELINVEKSIDDQIDIAQRYSKRVRSLAKKISSNNIDDLTYYINNYFIINEDMIRE